MGSLIEACRDPEIDAVIFDLGGVIINLNFELTFQALRKLAPGLPREHFVGDRDQASVFSRYEIGRVTTTEFIAEFNRVYGAEVSDENFARAWARMILDMPAERVRSILDLRFAGRKAFMLSNANELHEVVALNRLRELSVGSMGGTVPTSYQDLFDHVYWSHRVGMRKPNRGVFELILNEHRLSPGQTLFVDDSEQHIIAARELGLKTYHHERNGEW